MPIIRGFIEDLNTEPGLTVVTNAMSTQVNGDYSRVFDALQNVLARSVEAFGKQVLVCKLIASDLAIAGD